MNNEEEKFAKLKEQIRKIEAEISRTIGERDELLKSIAVQDEMAKDNPVRLMEVSTLLEDALQLHQHKMDLERRWRDLSSEIVKGYKKDKNDGLVYRLKTGAKVKLKGIPYFAGKKVRSLGSSLAKIGKTGIDKLKRKVSGWSLKDVKDETRREIESLDKKSKGFLDKVQEIENYLLAVEARFPKIKNGDIEEIDYSKVPLDRIQVYCDWTRKKDKEVEVYFSRYLRKVQSRYRGAIVDSLIKYQKDSPSKGVYSFAFPESGKMYTITAPKDLEELFEDELYEKYAAMASPEKNETVTIPNVPNVEQVTQKTQPLNSNLDSKKGPDIKPKKLGELDPEVQQQMASRMKAAIENKILKDKKTQLLSKYSDLINQRVFGKHWNGAIKHLEQKDIDEEVDNYLNNLIKVGEEKYGDNFIEDVMNEPTEQPIRWLMDEVSHGEDLKAMPGVTEPDPIVPDYSFMEAQPVEANKPEVATASSREENLATKIDKLHGKNFEYYLSNFGMTTDEVKTFNDAVKQYKRDYPGVSDEMAEKACIKSLAEAKATAGALTDFQALTNPDLLPEPSTIDKVDQKASYTGDSIDLSSFLNPSASTKIDDASTTIDYQHVASELTPDMVEHYRGIVEGFAPDTFEYKNAAAILNAYDNLQREADKQAAIDSLHTDKSR